MGLSSILHLFKGGDIEEAVIAAVAFGWLAGQGFAFDVAPPRSTVRLTIRWGSIIAGATVALSVGFTLLFPHRLLEHSHKVMSPVVLVVAIGLVFAALWILLSPRQGRKLSAKEHLEERERARAIVDEWGAGTLDYFALRDDKDWFFEGRSVVAYAVRAGVCLVSPDPIGPPADRARVWAEFLDFVSSNGWSVAVLGAAKPWLPIYESAGLRSVYFGDEAIVDCGGFSLAGGAHKSLRQAVGRVDRDGYVTTFHDPATLADDLRAELLEMSDQSRQGDVERGFSMTLSRLFDPADTGLLLSVTRNSTGRVDAFVQWVPARDIHGWSLDVMRRRTDQPTPNGLIESNIIATMEELASRGDKKLGLNFAVVRAVLDGEMSGPLARLFRPALEAMSERTQMESLAKFNEKFDPEWVPRYVVLDAVDFVAAQGLVMADAEGVTEIPVIGRFMGRDR
ncbi:hypothetical protein GCM10010407_10010 [Rarobacter incanus]